MFFFFLFVAIFDLVHDVGLYSPSFTANIWKSYMKYTLMQYTLIFNGRKNDDFLLNKIDTVLIFAQTMDCGYSLEPPQ